MTPDAISDEKPQFSFRTEAESEIDLIYVAVGNGREVKRKIKKEDFINPQIRFAIQDEMTLELMQPEIDVL